MIRSTRVLALAVTVLAAGVSAAAAQTKDTIIWNDAPPKAPAASASTSTPPSGPPIRDDYSTVTPPKTLVPPAPPTHAGDQQITWSEPSMPSKGAVGKSNTSASAAGPCREFQQDIVIDGQKQKAHGRVCQQSDGSWRIQN